MLELSFDLESEGQTGVEKCHYPLHYVKEQKPEKAENRC